MDTGDMVGLGVLGLLIVAGAAGAIGSSAPARPNRPVTGRAFRRRQLPIGPAGGI